MECNGEQEAKGFPGVRSGVDQAHGQERRPEEPPLFVPRTAEGLVKAAGGRSCKTSNAPLGVSTHIV